MRKLFGDGFFLNTREQIFTLMSLLFCTSFMPNVGLFSFFFRLKAHFEDNPKDLGKMEDLHVSFASTIDCHSQ